MKGVMNRFTLAMMVAVLAAVFLIVGALFYFFFRSLKIELPDMSPQNNAGAKMAEFPARASQAVVTVRLPFIPIRDLALQKIPTRIEGERQVPDQGGFSGIHINPNLNIGPTTLEPEMNSSPPRVKLTTRIHGSVGVRAFKWIIIDLLVDTLKTKSPELSETIDVDATVSGWVSPGLDGGWNFTHQEHFDVAVNKAEVVILGVIPISLKDKVQEIVNRSAPGIIASALDSIRTSLPIRAEVDRAWKELFKVVQVETDPNIYLSFVPEKVRLQTASFEFADFLTLRVALDGNLQAVIASETPLATSPSPLPDLLIEPVDPAFHVYLPVGLELTEANRALAMASPKDREIRLDNDARVFIRDLELYSANGDLYVKADVRATSGRIVVDGALFLECTPDYDSEHQILGAKDVDFSVETRNILAELAAWLLKNKICEEIESRVKININAELQKLQAEVNTRFGSIQLAPGVTMNSKLDKAQFDKIYVEENLIIVGFDLAGQVNGRIDLNAD